MKDETTYRPSWKSARAEQKYRAMDEAAWARATSTPPEAIDVSTRFGSTRAYRWAGDGPPIVFLHGVSDTSIRWVPFAEALADHDVYALDIIGDVGQSVLDDGLKSADDYAVWFADTCDALNLDSPIVVGHSFGGYLALSFAMTGRSSATVAIDPVGLVDLKLMRFIAWGFGTGVASKMPTPIRNRMAERLRQPLVNDKATMDMLMHANMQHPIKKLPPLPVFSDEQLAFIAGPLRVVVGAESTVFDLAKLAERVESNVPDSVVISVPGAGHAVTASHFEACLAEVVHVATL